MVAVTEGSAVDRIYRMMLAMGYPREAVDWLQRFRLHVIICLAIGAWGLVIGLIWAVWSLVA